MKTSGETKNKFERKEKENIKKRRYRENIVIKCCKHQWIMVVMMIMMYFEYNRQT